MAKDQTQQSRGLVRILRPDLRFTQAGLTLEKGGNYLLLEMSK